MHKIRAALIVVSVLCGQTLLACTSPAGNNSSANTNSRSNVNAGTSANAVNDNAEELGMLIALPFEPEDVVWKESDKKLTAVLRYTDENAAKLTSHLARLRQPAAETLPSEDWYPTELISQSEMSGNSTLKGQTYAADDFYRPPYTDGRVTRIDNTNLFVLHLAAP